HRGMPGKVFGHDLVHVDVNAAWIGDAPNAAHRIVRIALAFAAEDGIPSGGYERLPVDLYLAHAAARGTGDCELHVQTVEAHEPSTETFRRLRGERVLQLVFEPVENLLP